MPSVHFNNVEVIELPIVPGANHPMNNNNNDASSSTNNPKSKRKTNNPKSFQRCDSADMTVDWKAQSRITIELNDYEIQRQQQKQKKQRSLSLTTAGRAASFLLPRAVRKRM